MAVRTIKTGDGKYTFDIVPAGEVRILRHGQEWVTASQHVKARALNAHWAGRRSARIRRMAPIVAIAMIVALIMASCCQDQEQDEAVRAYECKRLCGDDDGERCPGSTASACNDECLAYQYGTDYCPGQVP